MHRQTHQCGDISWLLCVLPVQVRVSSDIAHVLSLPRGQLDSFLGAVGVGLASKGAVLQALQQCKSLMVRPAPGRGGDSSGSDVSHWERGTGPV